MKSLILTAIAGFFIVALIGRIDLPTVDTDRTQVIESALENANK